MVIAKLRDAQVEVNLAAIRHNVAAQRQALPSGNRIFGVVKANAYGHGAVAVAQDLSSAGIDGLCVATLDEGLELRQAGLGELILVLGITPVQYAGIAAENEISLTVGDVEWLKAYQQLAKAVPVTKPLKVHLGLDTGMGRIGFTDPKLLKQAANLLDDPVFEFEGCFTHFATADEAQDTYFQHQVERWHELLDALPALPPYVHMANSATGMWHPDAITGNTVRMGISMYGLNPSGTAIQPTLDLQPALAVTARLTFVKELKTGQSVSYGATYTANQDEWIGTIPVGYADGYARQLSGYQVLINGQRCDLVGRVCMDQMMVRLPGEVPVGTKVTLLGRDGNEEITATELADQTGTINYEILTSLSPRLKRIYKA